MPRAKPCAPSTASARAHKVALVRRTSSVLAPYDTVIESTKATNPLNASCVDVIFLRRRSTNAHGPRKRLRLRSEGDICTLPAEAVVEDARDRGGGRLEGEHPIERAERRGRREAVRGRDAAEGQLHDAASAPQRR